MICSKNRLAFSSLSQVEFEAVRALNGGDLFTKVKDEEDTEELVVFLSYELASFFGQDEVELAATLGTGIKDPGETLFVGGSVELFGKLWLTVGGISSEVAEEGNRVVDELGDALGTRDLFDSFSKRRAWEVFFAVSLSAF